MRKTPVAYRSIHLWVPELMGVGGIQQYSRAMLRALEEILPQTEIRVISKNDKTSTWSTRGRIRLRGVGNWPEPLRTPKFSALLMEQSLLHRPQLAILTHLHFAPVAYLLKRLMGLHYWVTAHGMEAWGFLSPLMKLALRSADKVLPVSQYTADRLEGVRLVPARSSVLPNSVDGKVFFPADKPAYLLRRYGLKADQPILFTLARLDASDRYKGYDQVLNALPLIKRFIPNVHYVFSGGGSENERVRTRVRELGLTEKVTLTGYLPEREVRPHYNLCDLFVMPSIGEGFGIVFLEALACGRPALAGNEDGAREALLDGRLGAVVNAADTDEIAKVVTTLLREKGASAPHWSADYLRSQILERFGFDAFKERLRRLLNSSCVG